MQKEIQAQILQTIRQACVSDRSITAAYLFGSAAKGSARAASDIDIALLLDHDRSGAFDLLSFITDIEKRIGRRADVIVLNRAGEVLKFQVRKYAKLLFERDAEKRKSFEVISRKHYEDFLYLHRIYTDRTLSRKSGNPV